MRMKNHTLFGIILMTGMVVGLVRPVTASENKPMDILQARIEKGLALLNDPPCRTPTCHAVKEERLWQLSLSLFDYATMSRLVLSSRWHDFTPQQQTAFVREFAAFLRRTYLPALLERYNGEQIEYVRQVQLSPTRARVDVNVLWRDRQIPISAKMIHREGGWKIYDVSSLGISAIKNYRAQFRGLLRTETPDQVIAILKARKGRTHLRPP
jgi:phospholipid transport system substrate-binding protein